MRAWGVGGTADMEERLMMGATAPTERCDLTQRTLGERWENAGRTVGERWEPGGITLAEPEEYTGYRMSTGLHPSQNQLPTVDICSIKPLELV